MTHQIRNPTRSRFVAFSTLRATICPLGSVNTDYNGLTCLMENSNGKQDDSRNMPLCTWDLVLKQLIRFGSVEFCFWKSSMCRLEHLGMIYKNVGSGAGLPKEVILKSALIFLHFYTSFVTSQSWVVVTLCYIVTQTYKPYKTI